MPTGFPRTGSTSMGDLGLEKVQLSEGRGGVPGNSCLGCLAVLRPTRRLTHNPPRLFHFQDVHITGQAQRRTAEGITSVPRPVAAEEALTVGSRLARTFHNVTPDFFGNRQQEKTHSSKAHAPPISEVLPGQHFRITFGNRVIAYRGEQSPWTSHPLGEVGTRRSRWRNEESNLGLFKDFRRAADALERLAAGMSAAQRDRLDTAPVFERLLDLEQSRSMWEAEVEGVLAKAEGKLKAAANSEARERTMQKRHEADLDPFGNDSDEVEEILPLGDVAPSEEKGLLGMPLDVAPDYKAIALSRKFG